MTIEIVDLPIENGGSFHRFLYVYQTGYIHQPPWQSHCENGGDLVAWGSASASSPRKMDGHPIAVAFDVSMAQKKLENLEKNMFPAREKGFL